MIRPYLNDLINNLKTQGEWKIQLIMAINFLSSKDSDETHIMHTKSRNIGILICDEANNITNKLFESLLRRYQEGLENKMRGSNFIYDYVVILYYKFHRISLNRGGSYIGSPKWLRNKKATINPKNNDDNCFQYVVTVALNHQSINNNPERITRIKPFIGQYNWKDIEFPSHMNDWKKFSSNSKSAFNILYIPHNTKEIRPACKSKHNSNRKDLVILLGITDDEKWHYLAVKKLSALLKAITSNNSGYFYCLNCFHSFRTKNKLKKHENVRKDHDYCYIEMPNENNKILKYNYREKSMKTLFVIYADLESLLEKINTCHNNPEKSSMTKINKHTASGDSLFTHCSFDATKNKLDYYRGKDCMKNFFKDLKKHTKNIVNYAKKEMAPLTSDENK